MASKPEIKSPVELQKHLKGVDYPASKENLIAAAQENGAPREVLDVLRRLPGDEFDSPADVMKAFGELT
jgi:hypothetical protein